VNFIPPAAVGTVFWSRWVEASPMLVGAVLLLTFLIGEALYHLRMGWKFSWRAPAAWFVRDMLLLLLWLDTMVLKRQLIWRGTVIEVSKYPTSRAP
jgi:hypothetical protein